MSVRRPTHSDGVVSGTSLTRYDVYLAALPIPLVVGVFGGLLTAVPVTDGAGAGAAASAALLCHGLFRDPPRPTGEPGESGVTPADD